MSLTLISALAILPTGVPDGDGVQLAPLRTEVLFLFKQFFTFHESKHLSFLWPLVICLIAAAQGTALHYVIPEVYKFSLYGFSSLEFVVVSLFLGAGETFIFMVQITNYDTYSCSWNIVVKHKYIHINFRGLLYCLKT